MVCILIAIISIVTANVWAAGSGEKPATGTEPQAQAQTATPAPAPVVKAPEPPVTIRYFRPGIPDNWKDDPIVKEINKKLNIDLQFVTASWSDYTTKRNLMLATGEEVDIMTYMADVDKWVKEEAVLKLDSLITKDKHPALYMLTHAESLKFLSTVGGGIYYIPMVGQGSDWSMGVRKDWMDKLGLSMPKNEEDFFNMLMAFKKMDPTGTVVGMQMEGAGSVNRSIFPILAAFGVKTSQFDWKEEFIIESGKLSTNLTAENRKAALRYLNRLYNAGLVNTDFPSIKSYPELVEKYLRASKSGVAYTTVGVEAKNIKAVDPAADFVFMPPWSAKGYTFARGYGGMGYNQVAIPASSKNAAKALEVIEWFHSKEGRMLLTAGIEGVHWSNLTADGYYDRNLDTWTKDYQTSSQSPYNLALGAEAMKGYIEWTKYPDFETAWDNRRIVEVRANKGLPIDIQVTLKEADKWMGAPNPYRFVRFSPLNDIRSQVSNAVNVGMTKMIACKPEDFNTEWDNYIKGLEQAEYFSKWLPEWQKYWEANFKK